MELLTHTKSCRTKKKKRYEQETVIKCWRLLRIESPPLQDGDGYGEPSPSEELKKQITPILLTRAK